MSTASDLAKDVAEVLNELGLTASLTHQTTGSYDPSTTTDPSQTPTSYTMKVVLVRYSDDQLKNTQILRSDRKAIMGLPSDPTYIPEVNDNLLYNGTTYQLLTVEQLELTGVQIAYICQARAGI